MDQTDEVGAAAAAEYFMQLFSYVMQTGDLTEWDRVSAQDCGFCANVRHRVDEVYADGGAFVGGDLMLGPTAVIGYDEQLGGFAIAVPFVLSGGAQLDEIGSTVVEKPEEAVDAVVDVIHADDGWALIGVSLAGQGDAS